MAALDMNQASQLYGIPEDTLGGHYNKFYEERESKSQLSCLCSIEEATFAVKVGHLKAKAKKAFDGEGSGDDDGVDDSPGPNENDPGAEDDVEEYGDEQGEHEEDEDEEAEGEEGDSESDDEGDYDEGDDDSEDVSDSDIDDEEEVGEEEEEDVDEEKLEPTVVINTKSATAAPSAAGKDESVGDAGKDMPSKALKKPGPTGGSPPPKRKKN